MAFNTTAGTAAEMTSNAVITNEAPRVKAVISDPNPMPGTAGDDDSGVLGTPPPLTAAAGMHRPTQEP
ncbi:hypothetical protein ER21_10245 [Cronobacter sakazakii]|nr:hypothetical protein ER21_10245 [Cronobacter sakazakii]